MTALRDIHKAIRADPFKKHDNGLPKKSKEEWKKESQKYKKKRLTKAERDQRVQERIAELRQE